MLFVVVDGGVIMRRSNLAVLEAQQPWEFVTHVAEILYRRDREGWRDALISSALFYIRTHGFLIFQATRKTIHRKQS